MDYVVNSAQWMGAHSGRLGVLVCLCGTLHRPRLAGQPETARRMLQSFTTSFDLAEDVHRLDDVADKYGRRLLPRGGDYEAAGDFLRRIAQDVERYARRARLKRVAGITNSRREPAGSGKDAIVVDLQRRGFQFRQARRAVDAVFNIWRGALAMCDEVETPIGWLEVQRSRRVQRQRVRFGKQQTLFKDRLRIRLTRIPNRLFEADTWNEESEDNRGDQMRRSQSDAICERCAGRWFAELEFKRYRRHAYGPLPGSELQQVSENSFPALVCLCGDPLPVERRRGGEEASDFTEAVGAARRVRDERARFEDKLQRFAAGFISREQAQTMFDEIAALQRQMEALQAAVGKGRSSP